jgi:N-acetylglucosaminyldiphosphoundecaprenol N-acetyl-beta-D-mannosaminyltransferase
MLNGGKRNVIGILIDAVDYDGALEAIFSAAERRSGLAVSALAVHGVMTGVLSRVHKYRLNHLDLLVPDGQPVRWMLNWVHRMKLPDRVYGPNLTLKVCERAAEERVPLYLYGSTLEILDDLVRSLTSRYPGLRIAGCEASRFRPLTQAERDCLVARIRNSGAAITLVGLGCPRQETFAYELREALSMPILAVGAAFPFLAGRIPQAPRWMQDRGLEWMFRLISEPRRLSKRYLYLNPAYLTLAMIQFMKLNRFSTAGVRPLIEERFG